MKRGMKRRRGTAVMALTGPFAVYEPYMRDAALTMSMAMFPVAGYYSDDELEEPTPAVPEIVGNRIAVLRFSGPVSKEENCATSMLGGFSSMEAARAIKSAADSGQFAGIALSWYTPGGQTAYMDELARVMREANAKVPIWSYCEDMCASAGYWAASQSSVIWCSPNAIVGSIGTYMAIEDSSKAAEKQGYEIIVIKAGEHKGDGIAGTAISDGAKARFQATIDSINATFVNDVAQGRGISAAEAAALNTGDVWVGAEAKKAGLVDEVGSFEEMLSAMGAALPAYGQSQRTVPPMAGAYSEEIMDKEKMSLLSSIFAFLGGSPKAIAVEPGAEGTPAPSAELLPAVLEQLAPVVVPPAASVDPLSGLSAEEKAAVLAMRAPAAPAGEPAAPAAPAADVIDLERDEAVASYVQAYNRTYGAGAIDAKRAAKGLAGVAIKDIEARASGFNAKAEKTFGKPTGERKSTPEGGLSRADFIGSGRY